jgi:hypothetical protein
MADETPTTVEEILPQQTGTGIDTPAALSQKLTGELAQQADLITGQNSCSLLLKKANHHLHGLLQQFVEQGLLCLKEVLVNLAWLLQLFLKLC